MITIMMAINFIIIIIIILSSSLLFLTNATSGVNTFRVKEKSVSAGEEFHGIATLTFGYSGSEQINSEVLDVGLGKTKDLRRQTAANEENHLFEQEASAEGHVQLGTVGFTVIY